MCVRGGGAARYDYQCQGELLRRRRRFGVSQEYIDARTRIASDGAKLLPYAQIPTPDEHGLGGLGPAGPRRGREGLRRHRFFGGRGAGLSGKSPRRAAFPSRDPSPFLTCIFSYSSSASVLPLAFAKGLVLNLSCSSSRVRFGRAAATVRSLRVSPTGSERIRTDAQLTAAKRRR